MLASLRRLHCRLRGHRFALACPGSGFDRLLAAWVLRHHSLVVPGAHLLCSRCGERQEIAAREGRS